MDFYTELKTKVDIVSIAEELGFSGSKTGNTTQGKCPEHDSDRGRCFTIWADSQRFNCFSCHKNGDVINLVQLYKKYSHGEAIAYLSKIAGITPPDFKSLTPEERTKKQRELVRRGLTEDMLTEAARFYNTQLLEYPDIEEYLRIHYGFSENLIAEHLIGFAPPIENDKSVIAEHLEGFP